MERLSNMHLTDFEKQILAQFIMAEQTGDSDEIVGVYERFLDKFENDAENLAHLGIVVNDSCWRLAETDEPTARLYQHLWERTNDFVFNKLSYDDQVEYVNLTN